MNNGNYREVTEQLKSTIKYKFENIIETRLHVFK